MVTILLATYNGAKFLPEQLDSLLRQEGSVPFRILIRDDGSSDGTQGILADYCRRYPDRIADISDGAATGSAMRNFERLCAACETDYAMFCDQDDVWERTKLADTYALMQEYQQRFGAAIPILVHTDLTVVAADLTELAPSFVRYQHLRPDCNLLHHLLVQNNITGCTMLLNKPLLALAKDGFPPEALMHDWWLGLAAAAFGKVAFLDRQTMRYRQHSKNVVGAKQTASAAFVAEAVKSSSPKAALLAGYRQGAAFLARYGDRLTDEQRGMVKAFVTLPDSPKLTRLARSHRYGLLKHDFLRRLGQYWYI